MDQGFPVTCPRPSMQDSANSCQVPVSGQWRPKSNSSVSLRRLGLASVPPSGRQVSLVQSRTLVSPCQNWFSNTQGPAPPQAEPDIVHVDKLMPYYHNFGEELHSWIKTDYLTQYRDRRDQTTRPAHHTQLTAVVDISSQLSEPASISETKGPSPCSHTLEPDPDMRLIYRTPLVMETTDQSPESGTKKDSSRQPSAGPFTALESEVATESSFEIAPVPLLTDQAMLKDHCDRPEVETTSTRSFPDPDQPELLVGSRSRISLPRRGTRL